MRGKTGVRYRARLARHFADRGCRSSLMVLDRMPRAAAMLRSIDQKLGTIFEAFELECLKISSQMWISLSHRSFPVGSNCGKSPCGNSMRMSPNRARENAPLSKRCCSVAAAAAIVPEGEEKTQNKTITTYSTSPRNRNTSIW